MATKELNAAELESALKGLGDELNWDGEIELTVIGAGAGILMGLLDRVTQDCDIALHIPKAAWAALERAALLVATKHGLSKSWLNAEPQTFPHRLPDGWRERAQPIGRFGAISVLAISRIDLIAMKFIAGRARDLEDLEALKVTTTDEAFVRPYLLRLRERFPEREGPNVDDRLRLLDDWEFFE